MNYLNQIFYLLKFWGEKCLGRNNCRFCCSSDDYAFYESVQSHILPDKTLDKKKLTISPTFLDLHILCKMCYYYLQVNSQFLSYRVSHET